jgi:hypothetical protein
MSRERVIINEVGPRDGLQNQARTLPPVERVRLIRALFAAGLSHIEAGSFVSPKAVPQMAGADQVLAGFTPEERAGFSAFVSAGFVDTFREFEQGGGHYTWWSPMGGARPVGPKAPAGQPDPLKTSVGYIGADSFTRQRKQQGGKPGAMPFGPRGKGRPR